MNEAEQMAAAYNLSIEQNKDKLMAGQPGLSNNLGNTHPTTRFLNNTSSQVAMPLNSYQYLSRNSANLDQSHLRADPSFAALNQAPPLSFQANGPSIAAGQSFQGMSINRQQQQALPANLSQINKNLTSSQANQHLQQHVIQQLLQEMMNKGTPHPSMASPVVNGNVTADVVSTATKGIGTRRIGSEISTGETSSDVKGAIPTTSDTSRPPSKSNNNSCISNNNYNAKLDALENMNLGDLEPDILREFSEGGFQW